MPQQSTSPPVVDSADVLRDPAGVLTKLCAAVGLTFTDVMLTWPPGPRATDGSWAKQWYAKVGQTTGFGPYRPKDEPVPASLTGLLRECGALYQQLHDYRL